MSIEFLERKKKALENVIEAYRAFKDALHELPPEWGKEVLADLAGEEPLEILSPKVSPSDQEGEREKPLPSEAICTLLAKHPEGLSSRAIIASVTGKFRTSSHQPVKLLYSTLATLKRSGKIEQGSDSFYRLKPKA